MNLNQSEIAALSKLATHVESEGRRANLFLWLGVVISAVGINLLVSDMFGKADAPWAILIIIFGASFAHRAFIGKKFSNTAATLRNALRPNDAAEI